MKFLEGRSGKEGKNKFMPPGQEGASEARGDRADPAVDRRRGARARRRRRQPRRRAREAAEDRAEDDTSESAIHALAFSRRAKLIAAGSYGSVQLLDATTRQPVRTLEGIAGKVNALVFSPDGAMLFAAAGDAGLERRRLSVEGRDGSLVRKFEGHTRRALRARAFARWTDARDGQLRSEDQAVEHRGRRRSCRLLSGHNGGVFGLSFRPDGKVLASASADRTVKLWDVGHGQAARHVLAAAQGADDRRVFARWQDGRGRRRGQSHPRLGVSSEAQEGHQSAAAARALRTKARS